LESENNHRVLPYLYIGYFIRQDGTQKYGDGKSQKGGEQRIENPE